MLLALLIFGCPQPSSGDDGPTIDDADGDGFAVDVDCDDSNPDAFPDAPEKCDSVDQNCNGSLDDNLRLNFYIDADGDGFGTLNGSVLACEASPGYVANADDCDDAEASVHPGATEICNFIDDNCDKVADDVETTWFTDADGDGFGDPNSGEFTCVPLENQVIDGTDCNDGDAAENPGAAEACDGTDNNCDGRADVGTTDFWYSDSDGDGFGNPLEKSETCDPEPGWVLDGSDCRPSDGDSFPGALERCNDVDDDCDTYVDEDFEADGDGYVSLECGGDDCDDHSSMVNPGVFELCEDGLDNDCDGRDSHCDYHGESSLADANAKVYSDTAAYDTARLIIAGDANNDGIDDALVATHYADGYKGGAYLVHGPLSGTAALQDVGYALKPGGSDNYAGRSIGMADVNDDGYLDFGVGAPDGTEKEWIVFGPIAADISLDDADIIYTGRYGSETGHGGVLADVNGDGIGDAVIGAYEDDTGGTAAGTTFISYGPLTAGDYSVRSSYDAALIGDAGSYAGRYVRAGGDVDGDGMGDVLLAAPYSSKAKPYAGAVYLVAGGQTGDIAIDASADAIFLGETPSDYAGEELDMGDTNGDGYADVVIGSYNNGAGSGVGAAYLSLGPCSGTVDLVSTDVVIEGDSVGHYFGIGLGIADTDGDDSGELVIGAIGDGGGIGGGGAAYLYFGPLSGSLGPADAEAIFYGSIAGEGAGEGIAFGDMDGNGQLDVLIGSPTESSGGSTAGAFYVMNNY